jgi:hypothetical protein
MSCAVMCCFTPLCAVLCCAVLCCAVLCSVIPQHRVMQYAPLSCLPPFDTDTDTSTPYDPPSRCLTSHHITSRHTSRYECHDVHHITHYILPHLTSTHLTHHLTTPHYTTTGAAPHREGQTVLAHAGRQGGADDCGTIHQFHPTVS